MINLVDILYIVVIISVVIITITIVWLASEVMGLTKSLRRSAEDTESMTSELKEKVHLISEALDRAGTAATRIIGLVEDAVETIKEKKDQLSNSLGLISGVSEYYRKKKEDSKEAEKEAEKVAEKAKASEGKS
jgi:methyl-accepting chemotaxis protein